MPGSSPVPPPASVSFPPRRSVGRLAAGSPPPSTGGDAKGEDISDGDAVESSETALASPSRRRLSLREISAVAAAAAGWSSVVAAVEEGDFDDEKPDDLTSAETTRTDPDDGLVVAADPEPRDPNSPGSSGLFQRSSGVFLMSSGVFLMSSRRAASGDAKNSGVPAEVIPTDERRSEEGNEGIA